MRHRLTILACILCSTPAFALDMPPRKAGLWEITMKFDGRNIPGQTVKHCIDAATDKLMNSSAGGSPQQNCDKQDMSHTGGMVVVDSVCHFNGATTTSHAEITGDFNSAYTMHVTSKRQGGPPTPGLSPTGETSMTIVAKWLGPCAAGQRPGDMIMSNGMKMNVLDLRAPGGAPGRVPGGAPRLPPR